MKKNNNRILIKESELAKIVEDSVRKVLNEYYASEKDFFSKRVDGLFYQIVENLILIDYFRVISVDNENLNHWRGELSAHCRNILKVKLKIGDKAKFKFLKTYSDNYFKNNNIFRKATDKLNKENISLNYKLEKEIFALINEQINNLIILMSKDDEKVLTDYIRSL